MTPRETVTSQIEHRETERVPYTLAFEEEVGDRLDTHFGGPAWRHQLVPYIVQCGSVSRPTRLEVDATHYRDLFGTAWRTDELPPVVVEPGLTSPSLRGYDFPTADRFLHREAVAAATRAAREHRDSFTIVTTGLCLWQSWYVRGFETTLTDVVLEEAFYAELLDRFTDLTLELVAACAEVPADAIMMGDDWGEQRGVLIGPERWRRLYKPRYTRIFEAIHAQGKLAIMHCCGSTADIQADIIDTGLDVLESVQPEAGGMDPYGLKQAWGDRLTYWGCLGSQYTVPFAAPSQVREEIRRLRREMSRGGGYILAPAKPLRTETPTANAVAVVEEFLDG
jgi:uroporphyrinogen decarboxylase